MTYHFTTTLLAGFDEAVARVRETLKAEGFGVITEIDVRKTLKDKLGVDFRPYQILGACNPAMAFEALKLEDKIGAMLPCNVVIQEREPGEVEVSAVDPVASMQAVDNPTLLAHAKLVGASLERAIENLRRE
jgi:uncharacterized protein (DUF302 family)